MILKLSLVSSLLLGVKMISSPILVVFFAYVNHQVSSYIALVNTVHSPGLMVGIIWFV